MRGVRPFVQIAWNWEIADSFNVYRATHPEGPWEQVIGRFPKGAHTAADYDLPKEVRVLYYRITSVDVEGNEGESSQMSSVRIEAD
jgi:hypothetical protein